MRTEKPDPTLLSVDRMFDLIVDDSIRVSPPAVLYHYTSWDGARGILTSQHFRARAHQFTNDAAELKTADDVVLDVARELRGGVSGIVGKVLDLFLENSLNMSIGRLTTVYLACFSAARDDQEQWRSYGDCGRGVCLGIRVLDEPGPVSPEFGSTLIKVDYSESSLRETVKRSFHQSLSLMARDELTRRNVELGLNALYRVAAFASIAAKQPQWAVEQEFRHMTILHKDSTITPDYLDFEGVRVPYLRAIVRAGGKRIALAEIILGPDQDPVEAMGRMQAILGDAGYQPEDPEYPSIVVSQRSVVRGPWD